jgi:hypothetical protein
MRVAIALACWMLAAIVPPPAFAGGSMAEVDAARRAAGNRRADAVALGTALFARVRSAQLLKVRVDGAGAHEVAGLVISGVKFHAPLDRAAFRDEVIELVRISFASSAVEEVDCWATVPLPPNRRIVVTGDMAQPTTKTVFAVSVRRAEAGYADRIRSGYDVFWDRAFAARLDAAPRQGASSPGAQSYSLLPSWSP